MNQTSNGFPRAVFSCSREEYLGLELTVKDSQGNLTDLPDDLTGHLLIIGPVGTPDSSAVEGKPSNNVVKPGADGWTPLFNGDGMIYRIDFHQTPFLNSANDTLENSSMQSVPGKAWLTTRLVKPPAYHAEQLTHQDNSSYHYFKFWNLGLARFSFPLGIGNQLNTALVPVQFPKESNLRLIATNDASRPFEIDPYSLKTLAPVGLNRDWTALADIFPFRPLITTAHPSFDPNSGQMYLINVNKSLRNFFNLNFSWLDEQTNPFLRSINRIVEFFLRIFQLVITLISSFISRDSVEIIRWQGDNQTVKKWKVTDTKGRPIKIKQSTHMMGLTQNYLLFADTAFKLVPAQMIPTPLIYPVRRFLRRSLVKESPTRPNTGGRSILKNFVAEIAELILDALSYPQLPYTYLYLIERSQLNDSSQTQIKAQPIKIEGEFVHFLTDYEDNQGKQVVIHPGMSYSSDPAEFIHKVDDSVFKDVPQGELAGMITIGMDINAPAVVAITPETGTAKKYELNLESARQHTPFLGLYAFREGTPTQQFEDIYWMAGGAWRSMLTERVCDLYNERDNRRVPVSEIKDLIDNQISISINRVHLNRQQLLANLEPDRTQNQDKSILTIEDSFQCTGRYENYLVTSPQFIPRKDSQGSTDGYISCVAVHSNNYLSEENDAINWSSNSEIWIFDANNLKQGPLYKLSHSQLNFGFTIHTSWLKEITPASPNSYNIEEDFKELVSKTSEHLGETIGSKVQDLFQLIYQEFNKN